MKTKHQELTGIQRIDLMIESMGGMGAIEERWRREQAQGDAVIRRLHNEEYLRERERMEKRNLLRDLLGI